MPTSVADWGRSGLVSNPTLHDMPPSAPFHVALCAVELPPGCRPPSNGMMRRLAVGRGPTPERAAFLALAEAAERYSLQYADDRPRLVEPFATVGGLPEPVDIAAITLGAPQQAGPVTSVGAAAGETRGDAAGRAVLEQLEHLRIRAFDVDRRVLPPVAAEATGSLGPHMAWLADQLRRLDCRTRRFAPGYWVAKCRCSDLDGSRPTEGSAAGFDAERTVLAAAEEAIFHWRNMVVLEAKGVRASAVQGAERAALLRYRGVPPERWPAPRRYRTIADASGALPPALPELMLALYRQTGRRVRMFDLTLPRVGVPVVRAVLG